MRYFFSALLAPLLWGFLLAVCLWLTRRFFPRAEYYLFGPLKRTDSLIAGTLKRWTRAIRHRSS